MCALTLVLGGTLVVKLTKLVFLFVTWVSMVTQQLHYALHSVQRRSILTVKIQLDHVLDPALIILDMPMIIAGFAVNTASIHYQSKPILIILIRLVFKFVQTELGLQITQLQIIVLINV